MFEIKPHNTGKTVELCLQSSVYVKGPVYRQEHECVMSSSVSLTVAETLISCFEAWDMVQYLCGILMKMGLFLTVH